MPRLIQKIEGSTSSGMAIQNNPTAPTPIHIASQPSHSPTMAENSSSSQKVLSGHGNQSISVNMSHISHFSEYPNIAFQPMALNNDYNTTFVEGCSYGGDKNDYDMCVFNQTNVSAEGVLQNPVGGCHVAGSNWAENDFSASMWNMDELWQYKS